MQPFATQRLGKTEVLLPRLGFGGAPMGGIWDGMSENEAAATLDAAWNSGIRFYDTSPYYGRGLSEHRIGLTVRDKPRSEAIVSTKVGRVLRAPEDVDDLARRARGFPYGLSFELRHDYSYDGIMRSYEDSLQRLGLNRIDLLIIHDLDLINLKSDALVSAHFVQLATGGINALHDLKARGLIGAIGAGVNHLGTIPVFLDALDIDFFLVASPYTLADQPALDSEFPLCEARGTGIIVGQVFASGILATGPVAGARYNYNPADEATLQRIGRIEAVCRHHGVPLAAAAVQFPLHHPLVASVIPGAVTPRHVELNIGAASVEIPDDLWRDLKRDGLLRGDAPTP